MSDEAKKWCKERGELFSFPEDLFCKERSEVAPERVSAWEKRYGDQFWQARSSWFKKPLACLHAPWKHSIWLDLDCEVKAPLDLLFRAPSIALAKDLHAKTADYPIYNSGVIAFSKGCPVIQKWAESSLERSSLFRGDQDLLSAILFEMGYRVNELPPQYNWPAGHLEVPDLVICHYIGEAAKATLRYQQIFH